MKNRKGFTLIELMIVVAIIGILAALAIPDFMKMLAKSKQSEAKTNLGSIFNLMTAYHGEHSTYADTFNLIGFAPEGENLYTYRLSAAATDCTPDQLSTENCSQIQTHESKGNNNQCDASSQNAGPADVTQTTFVCFACGNVDNDDFIDIWTVDESKHLTNKDMDNADANDVNN
ncbi:MAG: prepilin-type N-terminal cleavage/methylation domain-containing protein [bacterium]